MARSHGKILVTIWIDEDFTSLLPMEQWAFKMLLSQPKLNLVGCIDYQPGRWAQLARGLTPEDVVNALDGLEVAGFVCIDRVTNELLVRSITKHDGLRTNNPKLMKGLWGQWTGIASRMLRKIAVDNMPDALFDGPLVPESATQMRRSTRMERPIVNPIEPANSDANEPPSSFLHPTSAFHQRPIADANGSNSAPLPPNVEAHLRSLPPLSYPTEESA